MLGLLPNCYKLSVSESARHNNQDYIIDQADIDLPLIDDLEKYSILNVSNKKLQQRQTALNYQLFKAIQDQPSHGETLEDFQLPRCNIEPIQTLQGKQKAKIVE